MADTGSTGCRREYMSPVSIFTMCLYLSLMRSNRRLLSALRSSSDSKYRQNVQSSESGSEIADSLCLDTSATLGDTFGRLSSRSSSCRYTEFTRRTVDEIGIRAYCSKQSESVPLS